MQPTRGSSFEPRDLEAEFLQIVAERGNRIAHPSAGLVLQPDVQKAAHESARRHDHRATANLEPEVRLDAACAIFIHENPDDIALLEVKVRCPLELGLGAKLVGFFVALCSRRSHARAFAGIQHAKLNAGRVGVEPHHAAERVDLADHLALGLATDRRVARHLADRVEVLRQHERRAAEARCGTGGLDASVAGADDDHVVGFWVNEHCAVLRGTSQVPKMPSVARGSNSRTLDSKMSP